MVTQFVLRPTVSRLVWPCRCTPPIQFAGHDRVRLVVVNDVVIGGGAETAVTVTEPSTARLFATVKPGVSIVIAPPPVTGWLKMVNLAPTGGIGPARISFRVVPALAVTVPATRKSSLVREIKLFDCTRRRVQRDQNRS